MIPMFRVLARADATAVVTAVPFLYSYVWDADYQR
jgi:hypothetical protein